ncbi:MAG: CYTH domain-containing protein [Phycisphaerae bacterium]|nr:CYTH domain-containing protein [Phycisphaerae bacterium]
MQNVEFKAEIRDLEVARRQCALIGARRAGRVAQIDMYFRIAEGRLKRRESTELLLNEHPAERPLGSVEWIFYQRPDSLLARISQYTIFTDAQARVRYGTATLIPWKVVRKSRELWLVDNVRIHLDDVDQLGLFIEFEAVVSARHDVVECRMMVAHLREQFAPILGEPISGSYETLAPELEDSERTIRLP